MAGGSLDAPKNDAGRVPPGAARAGARGSRVAARVLGLFSEAGPGVKRGRKIGGGQRKMHILTFSVDGRWSKDFLLSFKYHYFFKENTSAMTQMQTKKNQQ